MAPLKLYWVTCGWRCGNAGDEFSREIVCHLSGRAVTQVSREAVETDGAEMVACGSLAEHLPHTFRGSVWGTGVMFEHSRRFTPNAPIHAVRGPLTARRWEGADKAVLGDPGLLLADVHQPVRTHRYKVGVVPHYIDGQNEELRNWATKWRGDVTVIDICMPVADVAAGIAECEYILSSSLHGLIFADALGVPNEWIVLSDKVGGGSFKFRDYYALFGITDPMVRAFGASTDPRDVISGIPCYHRPGLAEIQENLRRSFPR